jgi:NAD(P)-dependent dehydrogenase (short-subunit alcohol dehydrogenase family)
MTTLWRSERDIPDLTGKTYLVTGANSGLGLQSTRMLSSHGAHVVMACRSAARAESAKQGVLRDNPEASLELLSLDLSDLRQIESATETFLKKHERLDGLLNNAGLMALPLARTADGFEMQMGTNHLGHFALTSLLFPVLTKSRGRVVSVSSIMHRFARSTVEDLSYEKRRYDKWEAYANSKLANLLFTFELAQRAADHPVKVVAAHPGYSATDLQGKGPDAEGAWLMGQFMALSNAFFAQPAELGALPQLRALTDPEVESRDYFGPKGLFELGGAAGRVGYSSAAADKKLAAELWQQSVALTGQSFQGLS